MHSPASMLLLSFLTPVALAQSTVRVSLDFNGLQANSDCEGAAISASGRYVVFDSSATDIVGQNTAGFRNVFLFDRQTGQTTYVSVGLGGIIGHGDSRDGSISANGRFVAFLSDADNLVAGDANQRVDVFVRDRVLGRTERASVDSSGAEAQYPPPLGPAGRIGVAWMSADGRVLAFASDATNLVPGDTNAFTDVFVRELGPVAMGRFCFGDASAAACPCDNAGAPEHGCANSIFASGGLLDGAGAAILSADTVTLSAQSLSGNVCVFFQGTEATTPAVIDDGVGCVGGTLIRLGAKAVSSAASSYPQAGDLPISVKGAVPPAGGTRVYQAFYRNAAPIFCPPATTNRTNGVAAFWAP